MRFNQVRHSPAPSHSQFFFLNMVLVVKAYVCQLPLGFCGLSCLGMTVGLRASDFQCLPSVEWKQGPVGLPWLVGV